MIGKICGTGSYVPSYVMSNDEMSTLVDTSDEWIRERTGIRNRHLAGEETTSYMAAQAAMKAIQNSEIAADEIDLILVATSSSETVYPCAACEVQGQIGAVNAVAYDLNAACTGFILALNTAQAYIQAGIANTALVIGAESMSRMVDWTDRGTCILFGDGAGAVVLKATEESRVCHMAAHSDGSKGKALEGKNHQRNNPLAKEKNEGSGIETSGLQMDGQAVFKFAVRKVPELIEELLKEAGMKSEEVDYFILHQANRRIIEAVARRLKQDLEQFPMNLAEYANTSAASIPILLDEMNQQKRLKDGQKLVLAGFGAGLTWAGCLMEW